MELKELKEKARKLGVRPKLGMKKEVLIRSIQTAEGNFPCFGTAKNYCDRLGCCWRKDCLPLSK
jgi:hypothetical protein